MNYIVKRNHEEAVVLPVGKNSLVGSLDCIFFLLYPNKSGNIFFKNNLTLCSPQLGSCLGLLDRSNCILLSCSFVNIGRHLSILSKSYFLVGMWLPLISPHYGWILIKGGMVLEIYSSFFMGLSFDVMLYPGFPLHVATWNVDNYFVTKWQDDIIIYYLNGLVFTFELKLLNSFPMFGWTKKFFIDFFYWR